VTVGDEDGAADAPDAPDGVATLARDLRDAARRSNQRRLLVVAGDDAARVDRATRAALDAAGVAPAATTLVGDRDVLDCERVSPDHATDLLGTTRGAVVVDARDRLVPNALGGVVGAVDGGGLLLLLTPPLDDWPDRTDGFDATLAAPPADAADVTGRFRRRLADTLRDRPGVAVFDADEDRVVESDDATPAPASVHGGGKRERDRAPPDDAAFPAAVYEATLTRDQRDAVATLEQVVADAPEPDADANSRPRAAVVEADRGRGKSSAAGLAVGAVVAAGATVVVTAPERANAGAVFARAEAVLDALDARAGREDDGSLRSTAGGALRYRPPGAVGEAAADADLLVVDEAAALPVRRLTETLAAPRVVYATTVHGYEGTGRGFAVRFRDRLVAADHAVTEVRMTEPIRHAAADPVERWAFDALLLDARPPVAPAVADATPASVQYLRLDRDVLAENRPLLRETFGLLARAHYRTEPNDLVRLLDAPNVTVRALVTDAGGDETSGVPAGHVVSVALLAREGGLGPERRATIYEGERVRGHMVPDVLVSQLRDPDAAGPVGLRVLRIATHHAVRSRGLGSRLLAAVREEHAPPSEPDDAGADGGDSVGDVDYLSVGFGATPRLLSFWSANGYRTGHLSLTRNERSGEHSAVMLDGVTRTGRTLADRHVRWFRERVPSALSAPLSDVDPDVVRAALHAAGPGRGDRRDDADRQWGPDLGERAWRLVAGAAYGPGLYQVRPAPCRRLAVAGLADPARPLDADAERLLVAVVLQGQSVDAVTDALGYHSSGECLRAVGEALAVLVDRYGGDVARRERRRYD